MSDITLQNIAELLKHELSPINKRLSSIEKTLEVHTRALDTLLKARKEYQEEKSVSIERFKRLENWAEQVGQKLGIKLEL